MGKKLNHGFSETIIVYDLKLATDDQSEKSFLLTSKLCSLGAVCPCPGLYTCIKTDFKEISLKRATNGYSDKALLLT